MRSRKSILIVTVLILTALLSWKFYLYNDPSHSAYSIANFPKTFQEWTSQDLPIPDIDLNFLGTKNVLFRKYTNKDGQSINLYIAYSKSNPKALKPPEIEFSGTEITILDKGKQPFIISDFKSPFKINWLLLDHNKRREISYYWFKVGESYTSRYWKQQGLIAFNNIINKGTGSALIRVSTDVTDRYQQSVKLINEFIELLIPTLTQHLP